MTYQIIASMADIKALKKAELQYKILEAKQHGMYSVEVTISNNTQLMRLMHESYMEGMERGFEKMKQPAY